MTRTEWEGYKDKQVNKGNLQVSNVNNPWWPTTQRKTKNESKSGCLFFLFS